MTRFGSGSTSTESAIAQVFPRAESRLADSNVKVSARLVAAFANTASSLTTMRTAITAIGAEATPMRQPAGAAPRSWARPVSSTKSIRRCCQMANSDATTASARSAVDTWIPATTGALSNQAMPKL